MPSQEYQIVTSIIVVILVFLLGSCFVIALVLYLNQRKKESCESEEAMRRDFAEEMLKTKIEIQNQTSLNISREIHDNIAQGLTLAKLNLTTIDLLDNMLAVAKLSQSKDLVGKAIQDLRDMAKNLNSEYLLKGGLPEAIQRQIDLYKKMSYLRGEFITSGVTLQVSPQKELVLFRIVQEALSNIVKHAFATSFYVKLDYNVGELCLCIVDDGKGFDVRSCDIGDTVVGLNTSTSSSIHDGQGLINMRSRTKLIGGELNVISSPGVGTEIKIILPVIN